MMVSKNTGVKNSNEAEVMAILEALRMLASFFCDKLIVESGSANAIVWVSTSDERPVEVSFYFQWNQGGAVFDSGSLQASHAVS